jgi:RNA-directed DNA polymerase
VLSPLLANIALSVLDEHVMAPWWPDGAMGTTYRRNHRRSKGLPTWRIVRYADDFVVLVHGQRSDVKTLHDDLAKVLEPLGLRFSQAKTRILHMVEGFDFLAARSGWSSRTAPRWPWPVRSRRPAARPPCSGCCSSRSVRCCRRWPRSAA